MLCGIGRSVVIMWRGPAEPLWPQAVRDIRRRWISSETGRISRNDERGMATESIGAIGAGPLDLYRR